MIRSILSFELWESSLRSLYYHHAQRCLKGTELHCYKTGFRYNNDKAKIYTHQYDSIVVGRPISCTQLEDEYTYRCPNMTTSVFLSKFDMLYLRVVCASKSILLNFTIITFLDYFHSGGTYTRDSTRNITFKPTTHKSKFLFLSRHIDRRFSVIYIEGRNIYIISSARQLFVCSYITFFEAHGNDGS